MNETGIIIHDKWQEIQYVQDKDIISRVAGDWYFTLYPEA